MVHECNPLELPDRAIFMHHNGEVHSMLKHRAAFKGLTVSFRMQPGFSDLSEAVYTRLPHSLPSALLKYYTRGLTRHAYLSNIGKIHLETDTYLEMDT